MKPRHHVSRRAIELIKRFEGYRRTAAILPDGRWTIGYGHVKTAREGAQVTEDDAEALLIYDLMTVTRAVNDWTFTPLTENQFDALVCFAFNVGLDGFRSSSVLRRINEGEMLQAAYALEMWRKADFEGDRIVIDALVRRRAAEKALFLTPSQGWIPAPSAVLPPRLDYDLASTAPLDRPVHLKVPLDGAQARAEPGEEPDAVQKQEIFPAAVAADNLTARLQALVPDLAPDEIESAPAETSTGLDVQQATTKPQPESVEDSLPTLQDSQPQDLGLAQVVDTPAAQRHADQPQPQPTPVAPAPAPAPAPKMFQDHVTFQPIDARPVQKTAADEKSLRQLFGLGGVGLACLFFAIAWSLFAAPGDGVFNTSFVSTIAGLAGIGCVVASVYQLLVRLGGAEE